MAVMPFLEPQPKRSSKLNLAVQQAVVPPFFNAYNPPVMLSNTLRDDP